MIRHYKVPVQRSEVMQEQEAKGGMGWFSATASDVMNWTALAYFYAQESYVHNGIPVGMIVSSLGGSDIESWIPQDGLKSFPKLIIDPEAGHWAEQELDDSLWEEIEVPGLWMDQQKKGTLWFRKEINLPSSMAGRHAKIHLGTLIDRDSAFINGHYIGSTAYRYPPRKYDVPAGVLKEGKNQLVLRLDTDTQEGGFIPDKIYELAGDEERIGLQGKWKFKKASTGGSGLYNGMIYPLKNYAVRGMIWYQGESNTGRPGPYRDYLRALIAGWRTAWSTADMPFLIVQLPNFMKKTEQPAASGWAEIREAQLKVANEIPNTALAVTYDTGEWNDIHPLNKKDVASRLFLAARRLVYGESIVSSGPVFERMQVEGPNVILHFSNLGSGLDSRGPILKHFAVAGEDRKFVWADALIKGNTVVISSADVPRPVAVRYAWGDNPEDANLMNKEGLLASPFRTDKW